LPSQGDPNAVGYPAPSLVGSADSRFLALEAMLASEQVSALESMIIECEQACNEAARLVSFLASLDCRFQTEAEPFQQFANQRHEVEEHEQRSGHYSDNLVVQPLQPPLHSTHPSSAEVVESP